jgi:hypothetical protein
MKFKKGVILVVVFGILVLIAAIALIFLSVSNIERYSSSSYINKTRAYFTAVSGVEFAIANILSSAREENFNSYTSSWVYTGEDLNKNNLLDHNEDINKNGVLDIYTLGLESASVGSFNTAHLFKEIEGLKLSYKVAVFDENTKISLNWGCSYDQRHPSNLMLRRILDSLGKRLSIDNLGEKILSLRRGCFKLIEEIQKGIGDFDKLRHFVTVNSYFYNNRLVPFASYNSIKEENIYSLDYFYNWKFLTEQRAPININLALKEVLASVIEGLKTTYIDRNGIPNITDYFPFAQKGVPFFPKPMPLGVIKVSSAISSSTADIIAERITQERTKTPFRNWQDFYKFVGQLVSSKIITPQEEEILKVNFNPNLHLIYFNPDTLIASNIDKNMLVNYSPEFTFETMGYFSIESIGLVYYKDRLIAKSKIVRYVKLYDALYLDTQKDFVGEQDKGYEISNVKGVDTPGKKSLLLYPHNLNGFQLPNEVEGYIALSNIYEEWEKKYKNVTLRASFNEGLSAEYSVDGNAVALPDKKGYPLLLVDGAYSEKGRTLRYAIDKKFFKEKENNSQFLSLYRQISLVVPLLPGLDCDKYVYVYDMYKVLTNPSSNSKDNFYTIDKDKFLQFIKDFWMGSIFANAFPKEIADFLKDKQTDTENPILRGFRLREGGGVVDADSQPELHKKVLEMIKEGLSKSKCIVLGPHSCCFWDIFWGESLKTNRIYQGIPYSYDIHFFVGINQIPQLKKVSDKLYEDMSIMCGLKKANLPAIVNTVIAGNALECEKINSPPVQTPHDNTGVIIFWFKPLWGYSYNTSSHRGNLLLSMTRHSKDIREVVGKYSTSSSCIPLLSGEVYIVDKDGVRTFDNWSSAGIQDFYLAYIPSLPNVFTAKRLKFVIDAGFGYEKEEYNHKAVNAIYNFISGQWYSIAVAWDSAKDDELPFELYINGEKIDKLEPTQEHQQQKWQQAQSPAGPVNDGIRFGEITERFYNANEYAHFNPWGWGMYSADMTIDEIVTLYKAEENYPSLIKEHFSKGRYNNERESRYERFVNLDNIIFHKVVASSFVPYEAIFRINVEVETADNLPFSKSTEKQRVTINKIKVTFTKTQPILTLLTTPIVDDITLFYTKSIEIMKEYEEYGLYK